MKTFYTNPKKYVLLVLLSMNLILQNCGGGEVSQSTASTMQEVVKSGFLQEKQLEIDTDRSHEHGHIHMIKEEIIFTSKRKREEQKRKTLISQSKDIPQSKRKKLADSIEKIDFREKEKEEVCSSIKTNRTAINRSQLDLATILEEEKVLNSVFRNFSFKTRLCLTQVSTELYKVINDCEEIGLVGVDKIDPSKRPNPYVVCSYFYKDFSKVEYTPQTIPSIPFCRVMQQVTRLPKSYWPFIYKTNIIAINLTANGMTDNDFVELCSYLSNSRVRLVWLALNEITDQGIDRVVEEKSLLKEDSLRIHLGRNDITEMGQERLKSIYPNITWVF